MSSHVEVKVSADTSALSSGLAAASHAVEHFKEHTEEGFKELGKEMIGALAVGSVIEGLHELMEEFAKVADEAKRLDTTPEMVQRIAYAAKLCGTNFDAVSSAVRKVTNNAIDAIGGNEKMAESFEQLGINVEEFIDLSPDKKILELADATEKAEHSAAELGHAYKEVLGKSFGEMIPMFKEGGEELKKMMNEATVASNETVASMKENMDKIDGFWMTFKSVAATALAGTINAVQILFAALGTVGTFLAHLPDGFKAAQEAADEFGAEFWEKRKHKEEPPKKKTDTEAIIEAGASKKDKALKEEEEIARLKLENQKKVEEAELRSMDLLQRRARLEDEIAKVSIIKPDALQAEKDFSRKLDLAKELDSTNKEISRDQEREEKKAFEKSKKEEEARLKDIIAGRKKQLSESEKELSGLEKAGEMRFSVDDLRRSGGGVAGANYNAGAAKDELLKQSVTHAKQSVEIQTKILAALEAKEKAVASYDGGFSS